jgi:predicted PurR-regulated permease PerM
MINTGGKAKGITLVALVISIIVMLILAGVTISLALNGGLIDKAKQAIDKYNEAAREEQNHLNEINNYLDDIMGGQSPGEDSWESNPNLQVITTNEGINVPMPVGFTQVVSAGNSIN